MQEAALAESLGKLSEKKRAVFTVLCADRCVRIFDYNYSEGAPELQNSIALALNSFRGYSDKLAEEIEQAKFELEAVIPDLDVVGSQHTSAVCAGVAVLYSLEALISRSVRDTLLTTRNALDAVDSFNEYSGHGRQEEMLWQEILLGELQKLPEQFDVGHLRSTLNQNHPQWEYEWL